MRNEARDQVVYELKKMVESQLKQIVALQKEIEKPANPFTASITINQDAKKDQTIRDLRAANDELLAERRNLMDTVE